MLNLQSLKNFGTIEWQLLNLVPSPPYNVVKSHVVNFLDTLLNIVWWGWGCGGIWVEEGFKLHAHYCLKNTV